MHNHDDIKEEYLKRVDNYNTLGTTLKMNLESLLKKENIGFLSVNYRVKEIDSLLGKIKRKEYKDVFNEVDDFCGARIICYYTTDLKKIDQIIEDNFEIVDKTYKEFELGDDKFGYLSNHYIVKLKDDWCNIPTNECCKDLKAEIQVRTILMHAWADISHKLNYKTEDDSPKKLRRKLNQLSALFEMADGHFVELKEMKEKYIDENKTLIEKNEGNTQIEENIDSLRSILDTFYPDRIKSPEKSLLEAYNEIKNFKISFSSIVDMMKKLPSIEINHFEKICMIDSDSKKLAQVGILRMVMSLISETYNLTRNETWSNNIKSLNNRLKNK